MTAKTVALIIVSAVLGLGAGSDQLRPVNRLMRDKLGISQKILEAVVTSDWAALEKGSGDLQRLVDDPRWVVLGLPEYGRHSTEFRTAVVNLHTAAARRDLEATPQAYVAVTLQCVACHRYLARARIARTD